VYRKGWWMVVVGVEPDLDDNNGTNPFDRDTDNNITRAFIMLMGNVSR
jgi:hypothetical protein